MYLSNLVYTKYYFNIRNEIVHSCFWSECSESSVYVIPPEHLSLDQFIFACSIATSGRGYCIGQHSSGIYLLLPFCITHFLYNPHSLPSPREAEGFHAAAAALTAMANLHLAS